MTDKYQLSILGLNHDRETGRSHSNWGRVGEFAVERAGSTSLAYMQRTEIHTPFHATPPGCHLDILC